jgi:type III restriction enzyme
MKLQFEAHQTYQLAAIQSVVGIFEGQPLNQSDFDLAFQQAQLSFTFNEKGVGNSLVLSEAQILANLQAVQQQNNLSQSQTLDGLNFTVEMETGTGKTYVYLRTIYELNKVYGFKKFVVVVPSIAIREGVLKNLEITQDHLQTLYDKPAINFSVYDSKKLTGLKSFAGNNAIQILIINIDSFAKDANIINQMRESGLKPIEYIQATRPIVIVDEPQNMETDLRQKAIANLNPLCTLRYSATHKHLYNLIYRLDPVAAYDLGLVKQIEVDGITADENYNAAFVQLDRIKRAKTSISATLKIYVNQPSGVVLKTVTVKLGDDLYQLSNQREIYRNNFIVNRLNTDTIIFANGLELNPGQSQGGLTDEVMKYQLERTIETHLAREKRLQAQGIKVLSLFFIDRVANYRSYDQNGQPQPGKFARWFEEILTHYLQKPQYQNLYPFSVEQMHDGYFSQDKIGHFKDSSGTTQADDETYNKIMKNKEQLLSVGEPLRFIFSHSALREGWDNPNVFQICTLNETKSDMKKRQEIGRGLRLPVDSTGTRIFDKTINQLTVIANETYTDFSERLQQELQEECGVEFTGRIKNARDKAKITLTKDLSDCPEFQQIWNLIKQKTVYRVQYSTAELIEKAVAAVKNIPPIARPMLTAQKFSLSYSTEGVEGELVDIARQTVEATNITIPDVYSYIQGKVNITRRTIFEILKQSGRVKDLTVNPQLFLDNVVQKIHIVLHELMVDGIKYEKLGHTEYEMRLFANEEIETYLSNLFKVTKQEKTIYNYIPVDSNIEEKFAQECEADSKVIFYFKLPRGFKIPTPLGNYIPDWAVILENDHRLYFVAETKSTLNNELLRGIEELKIKCGKKHFIEFEGVIYRQVTEVKQLYA